MKKIINFFTLFCAIIVFAQNSFDYNRSWATYFGGINTWETHLFENNQGSVFLDSKSFYPSSTNPPSVLYYNQFRTIGMGDFTNSLGANNYFGKINANDGNVQYFTYEGLDTSSSSNSEEIILRETSGNFYKKEIRNIGSVTTTSNVWLPNSVETTSSNTNFLLAKYNAAGILLWRTYLPTQGGNFYIISDADENIYISGDTLWQNLGDAGSYQQNFIVDNSGGTMRPNSYLVKLNNLGQKLWATYLPVNTVVKMFAIHANNVYLACGSDFMNNISNLATLGTFQQTKANQSLLAMDGSTGQRIWGTYYGSNNFVSGIDGGIAVDNSGIYLLGFVNNYLGNPSGYFSTVGAFQTSLSGNDDLYLTKFNFSGNRIWSTYFGGSGMEAIINSTRSSSLSVKNNKILFTGVTTSSNIATTGAFVEGKPNANSQFDFFFSMFTTDGQLIFTSYYGGNDPTTSVTSYAISPRFSNDVNDGFYLYGTTPYKFGFTTNGAWQPNIIYPNNFQNQGWVGFVAKFTHKNLSTSELQNHHHDIVLYNNPNNGSFFIKSNLFLKQSFIVEIIDSAGRRLSKKKLEKNETNFLDYSQLLIPGNYFVYIKSLDGVNAKTFKMTVK